MYNVHIGISRVFLRSFRCIYSAGMYLGSNEPARFLLFNTEFEISVRFFDADLFTKQCELILVVI